MFRAFPYFFAQKNRRNKNRLQLSYVFEYTIVGANSHKQKMKGVKAVLQENELILKVDTQEDITLEKGFFQTSTEFFKEVYSITPVIRQKKKF